MDIALLQKSFLQQAKTLGFIEIRFSVPPLPQKVSQNFATWLHQGLGASMEYLSRRQELRLHPEGLLKNLKSVVSLAYPYDFHEKSSLEPEMANISRYAWGEDYHEVIQEKLAVLQDWLKSRCESLGCYMSCDAQPVLEKAWAQKSGLGWQGKHTNMILSDQGSYFFLATLLTNLPFEPDPALNDHCGSCSKCLEVCPTGAIIAPYVLDAGRCISYLTIELKGYIPRELRAGIGNHVFGCDDCQDVCPWNRFSTKTPETRFSPREQVHRWPLRDLLELTPELFKERFRGSAIWRTKWRGLMRNALVAAGNSGEIALAMKVKKFLTHSEALLRGHAVWAYYRLLGESARPMLASLAASEEDVLVLEEYREVFGQEL